MATPSAMIVWPLTTPSVPSTDAVALATQTADCNCPNCCGHPPALPWAEPEGRAWRFAYVESENACASISMKTRPSDPTSL